MRKKLSIAPNIDETASIMGTVFGDYTEIGKESRLENVEMGDYSYCGGFCIIQNAVIGKFVNIAENVRIGTPQHPIERASLHHFTYRRVMYGFDDNDDTEFFKKRKRSKVIIGHDVWIGHGVIIMDGVKIGDGAVIGSGAVVTKDVQDYSIVAGVPAVKIKHKFDEITSKKLKKIKWWNWSHSEIKNNFNDFLIDINKFVDKYYKEGKNEGIIED